MHMVYVTHKMLQQMILPQHPRLVFDSVFFQHVADGVVGSQAAEHITYDVLTFIKSFIKRY